MLSKCYDILRAINNGADVRDMMLRVVDYARVSTASREQRKSFENQLDTYRDMIENNPNWTYTGTYSDEAVTGTKAYLRGGFKQMIADASTGMFDLIIVKNVSRFARNIKECLVYKDKLKSYGVIIFFVENNLNSFRMADDMMFQFMSLGAEMEAKSARDRTKIVFSQGIDKGKVYGNSKILGYTKDNCKLILDEAEAEIVKKIFDLYVHQRMGLRRIAKKLANQGLSRKDGTSIPTRTINTVLCNPKYKGYYCGRKTEKLDMGEKYVRRNLPESEWVLYRDESIPVIVSEELWDEASKIRLEHLHKYHEEVSRPCNNGIYRYSGKIESGLVPGVNYTRTVYRYKETVRESWQCRNRKDPRHPENIGPTIYTEELDTIIHDMLHSILGDYNSIIANLMARYCAVVEDRKSNNRLTTLKIEQKKIQQKQGKLLELYEDEAISKKAFMTRNQEHKMRLDEISCEIERLEKSDETTQTLLMQLDDLRKTIVETTKEVEPSKETIECLIEKIVVRPESTKRDIIIDITLKTTKISESFIISRQGSQNTYSCHCGKTGS